MQMKLFIKSRYLQYTLESPTWEPQSCRYICADPNVPSEIPPPFSTPNEARNQIVPHFAQQEAHRANVSHECGSRFDCIAYIFCQRKRAHQAKTNDMQGGGQNHKILQLLRFFRFTGTPCLDTPPVAFASSSSPLHTAISIAVSKISCTPFISLDEHSIYMAPIFSATARPCCCVTGVRPCVLRSSIHVRLLRKSDFRPQRIIGVVGQK